jgi:hypothetical protein
VHEQELAQQSIGQLELHRDHGIASAEHLISTREKQLAKNFRENQAELLSLKEEFEELAEQVSSEGRTNQAKIFINRAAALQQTIKHPKEFISQQYQIDSRAKKALAAQNIDFINFSRQRGNAIQNQIHSELVTTVNVAGILWHDYHTQSKRLDSLTSASIACSDAARVYNDQGNIAKACWMSDFASSLLTYLGAIGQGIAQGMWSNVSAIIHPIDTAINVAKALDIVAYYTGMLIVENFQLYRSKFMGKEDYPDKVKARRQQMDALYTAIVSQIESTPGPKLVGEAVALVAGFYLTPSRSLKLLRNLFNTAQQQAKLFKGLDFAVPGFAQLPDLKKAKAIIKAPTAALINKGLDVAKDLAKSPLYITQGYVQEFRAWLEVNKITLVPDLLISPEKFARRVQTVTLLFKEPACQLQALEELKAVTKFFKEAQVTIPPIPGIIDKALTLKFDADHAFLPRINFRSVPGKVAKITGLHADVAGEIEALGKLGEADRLIVTKAGKAFNGFEEVILGLGDKNSKIKTIFPNKYSWMDCARVTVEAAKNILIDTAKIGDYGEFSIQGITSKSKIILMNIDKASGKVRTFYGDINQMIKLGNKGL